MKRHMVAIILAVLLTFNCTAPVLACNEEQSNTYIMQLLFGDKAALYENDPDVAIILDGLYICSIQADKNGAEKLRELKKSKVGRVSTLKKIDVSNGELFDCAHNRWDYISKDCQQEQELRKNILRCSVTNVFDFGWYNETFKKDQGQIDSFSALLYYSHILADYLADDPLDTRVSAKGYDVPSYLGAPYIKLKKDNPKFTNEQRTNINSCERYSNLDGDGRCGPAMAIIGVDTLQSVSPRGYIENIKPTGWNQASYEVVMSAKKPLYNRCHLIAHSLGGKDDRINLITGTDYLNTAMGEREDAVLAYVKTTGNHVIYKVTPVFVGKNQVASGVQLEGYSLEDQGKGVHFNRYYYNVQPGVDIDYSNGSSEMADCTVNNDYIIPFAINGANRDNPDLMFEIEATLEKLFSGQSDRSDYSMLMNKLKNIATESRNIKGKQNCEIYKNLKPWQHAYMETLTEYVPKLLQNEEFFQEILQ